MRKYFLDTSVIISYLRGKKEANNIIDDIDGELVSSYVCLSELYEGIFRVKDRKVAEEAVGNFFKGMDKVYGMDINIAKEFGRIRSELKKESRVIEDMDILIAATCIAYNLTLVTFNRKHFERVRGLTLFPIEE
jgi:tRNA(fMet)-specific endonuclease VapC